MPTLIAGGAFCPIDDLAEAFRASGWRVVAPAEVTARPETEAGAVVCILEDGPGALAAILTETPSARGIVLHVPREEAIARALGDGLAPETALERWRASAREQAALFRRMRDRVTLVSRQRFQAAPASVLADAGPAPAPTMSSVDPIALALAWMALAQAPGPDAAASLLSACVSEPDRNAPVLDGGDALAAWRRHAACAAEAAERETALRDEIALLREQLAQMQVALETTWRSNEENRAAADAARGAQTALSEAEKRRAAIEADLVKTREALAVSDKSLEAAEAKRAAAAGDLAKARETLAARDKTLAERDAALKAAEAHKAAAEAELAKAREQAGAHETELAEMREALTTAQERLAAAATLEAETARLREETASQSEEIGLLREQLEHLQHAFETAWLQKEETRASASRQPPVREGLTRSVDLLVPDQPAP